MQELEHRVKNTLALVQSISNQTFRDAASLDDARQTLTQRLLVLGKAHDLLTQTSWTSASIGTVIASATAPYVEPGRQRFSVAGPELSLAPKPALALTMALHELCTNAAKYGALSNGAGQVSIGWDVAEGEHGRRLHFAWAERGGPPVAAPSRKGFGTRLIERSLAAEFNGEVEIAYEPEGVVCRVEGVLASVQGSAAI
jgi:two-component sensor histidine kinase